MVFNETLQVHFEMRRLIASLYIHICVRVCCKWNKQITMCNLVLSSVAFITIIFFLKRNSMHCIFIYVSWRDTYIWRWYILRSTYCANNILRVYIHMYIKIERLAGTCVYIRQTLNVHYYISYKRVYPSTYMRLQQKHTFVNVQYE